MASGGRELSARMLTDVQDTEDPMEIVFDYFKKNKVRISYAIKKSFPFLEGLRDRELITNKMYDDYQESCRHLVPVQKVTYEVLNELEKTFDLAVLDALFSEVNREEYPDLVHIYKDFHSVIHDKLCLPESDGEEREDRPHTKLRLAEGTRRNSASRSLTWACLETSADGKNLAENGLADRSHERRQINGLRKEAARGRNDAPGSHQADKQTAQEPEPEKSFEEGAASVNNGDLNPEPPSPSSCDSKRSELHSQDIQMNSCSVLLVDIKKEKPFYSEDEQRAHTRAKYNQATDVIVISSDSDSEEPSDEDSEEPSDEDDSPIAFPSALRSQPEIRIQSPLESNKKKETQEATCSYRIKPKSMNFRDSPTFRRSPLKRERERILSIYDSSESSEEETLRICTPEQRSGRSTMGLSNGGSAKVNRREEHPEALRSGSGPRIRRDSHADFHKPELPVTCGNVSGTLIKEVFKQGVWKKSIRSEDGSWFSPSEFEAAGGRASSKNWKLSVRSHGWTLKELIQKGILPNPPSKQGKQRTLDSDIHTPEDPYPENSNECEVCDKGGILYCCDTCPKSYHENCHIPPVEIERDPWSCTFCMTEAIQKRCLESPPCHQESEVLMRKMDDEEKLKCELLLLKVCCSAERAFPSITQCHMQEAAEGQQECLHLGKIKTELDEKYVLVKEFVQDIRRMFQSYKALDEKYVTLACNLEAKFEKNFKKLFSIRETTPNNHPSPCPAPFSC